MGGANEPKAGGKVRAQAKRCIIGRHPATKRNLHNHHCQSRNSACGRNALQISRAGHPQSQGASLTQDTDAHNKLNVANPPNR